MRIKINLILKKFIYIFLPSRVLNFLRKKKLQYLKKSIIRLTENTNIKSIKNFNNFVFEIHKSKLRYFGGLKFSKNSHPFLKYLLGNRNKMSDFYLHNQPDNILTSHRIKNEKGFFDKNFLLNPESCLPWLESAETYETIIEGGLDFSDGRQQFGPVSDAKINFEIERLNNVKNSINKYGFIPQKFDGYPRGHFICKSNNEWVFYIVGGSHRIAALVSLNFEFIPVILQQDYPTIVEELNLEEWPKVKENKLSKIEAKKIFLSYF